MSRASLAPLCMIILYSLHIMTLFTLMCLNVISLSSSSKWPLSILMLVGTFWKSISWGYGMMVNSHFVALGESLSNFCSSRSSLSLCFHYKLGDALGTPFSLLLPFNCIPCFALMHWGHCMTLVGGRDY